jgi:hypothetical protein
VGGIIVGIVLLLVYAIVTVASTSVTIENMSPATDRNHSLENPTSHWRSWQRSLQQAVSDSNSTTASFDVQRICALVEQAFSQNVTCKCAGTVVDNFSITCDYRESICNSDQNATCGVPQMALAMVHGQIFSATTCISQYRRGSVALQDTCVFVDACVQKADATQEADDLPLFCGCTASYGGAICQACHVCDGAGTAITVDCTNINAEAISKECTALDVDLRLQEGTGQLAGFAPPSFSGFCSALEGALDNRIACDCTNAVGGSYNITCRTIDAPCDSCDTVVVVESAAAVVEGRVRTVMACAENRAMAGTTCTTVELSEDNNGTEAIGACSATYNGDACTSCTLCDAAESQQQSIRLDCSNRHPAAVLTECQAIDVSSSYEFVPNFYGNQGISLPTSAATSMFLGMRSIGIVLGILLFPSLR